MKVKKQVLVALLMFVATFNEPAMAQNLGKPNVLGGIIGNLLLNAQINNARNAWNSFDPNIVQCINTETQTSIPNLVSRGVMPNDYRVAPLIQACQNQIAAQQVQAAQQQAAQQQAAQQQAAQQQAAQQQAAEQQAAEQQAAQQATQDEATQQTTQPAAPSPDAPVSTSEPPATVASAPIPINPLTGPSFPCPQPNDPLAQLVCSTPELALLDMKFVQTYEALYQQAGVSGQANVRQLAVQFDTNVRNKCGIALSQTSDHSQNPPPVAPAGSAGCVIPAYQQQVVLWKNMLTGPALEEANRPIQDQVALQSRLQSLGFLAANAQLDAVFGTGTRTAIEQWQTSIGRQPTGVLGNDDALALLGNTETNSQTNSSSTSQSEQDPASPSTQASSPVAPNGGASQTGQQNNQATSTQTNTDNNPQTSADTSTTTSASDQSNNSQNNSDTIEQSSNGSGQTDDDFAPVIDVLSVGLFLFLTYSAIYFAGNKQKEREYVRSDFDKGFQNEPDAGDDGGSDFFAEEENEQENQQNSFETQPTQKIHNQWFEILGVDQNASIEDIRTAWHRGLKQYHPDLVASLGPKLREIAEEESKALNKACLEGLQLRTSHKN